MEYINLGKSNLRISRIGFGCMSLSEDEKEAAAILNAAVDMGINYFDTADLYQKGLNEINVGKALKTKRKELIIATKVGNQGREDGSGWDWNPRKDYILSSVEKSLQRLQTDYIDLYQLHGGTIEDPIDETIEAFELLKQQGKILDYGISSIRPNVIREYVNRSGIVSVMMQYSLLDRRPEETCFELLQQNNIGILARGTVASGLLAGKPVKEYLQYEASQVANAANKIASFSDEKRNAAQVAIRFVLQHPPIAAAVVGIRTFAQLQEAVHTMGTATLTKEELSELENLLPANKYEQHR